MKNDIQKKLGALPELSDKSKLKPSSGFSYRSPYVTEALNARIPAEIKDKIERQAYQNAMNVTEVLVAILAKYYDGKDFPPVPEKTLDI